MLGCVEAGAVRFGLKVWFSLSVGWMVKWHSEALCLCLGCQGGMVLAYDR